MIKRYKNGTIKYKLIRFSVHISGVPRRNKVNYSEALNYINNIDALGSKLGLSRIKTLLDSLGNPQEHLRIIHTAGTNGKGSVCSMISHVLMAAGYKTALYVSPHLERYNERYRINDIEISDDDFAKYIGIVKEHSEGISNIDGMPTVFEQLTAAAFLYFYDITSPRPTGAG